MQRIPNHGQSQGGHPRYRTLRHLHQKQQGRSAPAPNRKRCSPRCATCTACDEQPRGHLRGASKPGYVKQRSKDIRKANRKR